jgi:hypothetical protein
VFEELLEGVFELGFEGLHHLDLVVWQLNTHARDFTPAVRWKDQVYYLLDVVCVLYILHLLILLEYQTLKVLLVQGKPFLL